MNGLCQRKLVGTLFASGSPSAVHFNSDFQYRIEFATSSIVVGRTRRCSIEMQLTVRPHCETLGKRNAFSIRHHSASGTN